MNKEDVLLRSKNENKKGDELQRSNKLKSEGYGYYAVSVILLAFAILTEFDAVKGVVGIFWNTGTISRFLLSFPNGWSICSKHKQILFFA